MKQLFLKQHLLLLPHYGNVSFPITTSPDFKAGSIFSFDQYSQKQTSPELPELLKLSSKYASMSIFLLHLLVSQMRHQNYATALS
jgi:hypothetical protein